MEFHDEGIDSSVILYRSWRIIKTRPDNTIILHPSKTYTREEVRALLVKLHDDLADRLVSRFITFEEWESNNL